MSLLNDCYPTPLSLTFSPQECFPVLFADARSRLWTVLQRMQVTSGNVFEIVWIRAFVPEMKQLSCFIFAIAAPHSEPPTEGGGTTMICLSVISNEPIFQHLLLLQPR